MRDDTPHLLFSMNTFRSLAIATAAIAWAMPARAVDHPALARQTLERHIRPGYARLAEAGIGLRHAVADLCADPSEARLGVARDALADAILAFARVEHLRFGPMAGQQERLFFWPDPIGLGQKQVRAAIAARDASTLDPASLRGKSVALQGFPALDTLLGADDALPQLEDAAAGGYRCGFASAIAANIAAIADEVRSEWAEGGAWAKAFGNPAADSSIYRSPSEITRELFKAWTGGIEWVRDQKLLRPLGESPERARPGLLPFAGSNDLAFRSIAANLEGLRALFVESGFQDIVAMQSPGLDLSALFDLDHGIAMLASFGAPPADVLHDQEARGRLEALAITLKSLEASSGETIAKAAQITFGFNAMDGD